MLCPPLPTKNRQNVKNTKVLVPRYDNVTFVHADMPITTNVAYGNLADIVKRGELVVCALKRDYNQFFQMKVKDGYIGEDIRFASELGKALGVKVVYKMLYETYDDVVDAIHNGEGDVGIAKISYTQERARKVAYSEPYLISRKVILINRVATAGKESNTLDKVLNTPSARIAVMENTCYESFAEMLFPKAQILHESEWENGAIKKLREGTVIAVIRDELRIKTLISAQPNLLINFMPLILKGESDSISAITNIKGHSLISYINKFIENDYKVLTGKEVLDTYKDYVK